MRKRTLYDDVAIDWYNTRWCYLSGGSPNCQGQAPSSATYTKERHHSVMIDVSTPNYKRLSAEGKIVNNPLVQETIHMTGAPLTTWEQWHTSSATTIQEHFWYGPGPFIPEGHLDGDYQTWITESLAETEGLRQIAISSAWSDIDQSKILALASLYELPETLKWLRSIYSRTIAVGQKAVKRRMKLSKRIRKDAEATADFWMEMRYALRPLVFEMYNVAKMTLKSPPRSRATGRGYCTTTDTNSSIVTVKDDAWTTIKYQSTVARRTEIRAGVLFETNFDNNVQFLISQLGLDRPFSTIWELTKLSFVMDWFFNVGDVISRLDPAVGLTPLCSWVTDRYVTTTTIAPHNVSFRNSGGWYIDQWHIVQPGTIVTEHTLLVRNPSPVVSYIPTARLNLNFAKLIDLGLIARQVYRSIK